MKINDIFQSRHLPNNDENVNFYVALQEVEKDICLLYHQLSEYSYIMGDLYYGDVYDKKYWNYLSLEIKDKDQHLFITNGCLVMILAMCSEILDGTGGYIYNSIDECIECVKKYHVNDIKSMDLKEITLNILSHAKNNDCENTEIFEKLRWVHINIIRDYFISKASDFVTKDYYK